MSSGDVALLLTGLGGLGALGTGIAAWVKSRAERSVPTRTVAVAEVDVALRTLGETIDRLEVENVRMHNENDRREAENKRLRAEVDRLEALVSQLRGEVERLRQVVEPDGPQ